MCNKEYNERLLPLNQTHLADIKAQFPHQSAYADELYAVLTKDLSPQVNLFVTFMLLKEMFDQNVRGIFGTFGKVLYAPLSIVAKTGEHEWTRFRPRAVNELHTSFLSFMMAKPNRHALNALLGRQGLCFSQAHCCGITFGAVADIAEFEKSELFKARNTLRSYAESMAMPVVEVPFEEVPLITSDLGDAERTFYKMYEEVFAKMTPQQPQDFVDTTKDALWDSIVVKVANVPEDSRVAVA